MNNCLLPDIILEKLYVMTSLLFWFLSLQWRARVAQWIRLLDYLHFVFATTHTSLSPIRRGFAPGFVYYKKGCTRLSAASDKVNQWLSHGRWFSPGIPASSSTKTGRHDISEILLKVGLKHLKSNQINHLGNAYLKSVKSKACFIYQIHFVNNNNFSDVFHYIKKD